MKCDHLSATKVISNGSGASLDPKTGEIVGVNVCDRSSYGAKGLWQSLRASISTSAQFAIADFWGSYELQGVQTNGDSLTPNRPSVLPTSHSKKAVTICPNFPSEQVIPNSRHRAVGKNSGKTNGIERFNCTLRPLRFRV